MVFLPSKNSLEDFEICFFKWYVLRILNYVIAPFHQYELKIQLLLSSITINVITKRESIKTKLAKYFNWHSGIKKLNHWWFPYSNTKYNLQSNTPQVISSYQKILIISKHVLKINEKEVVSTRIWTPQV